MAGDKSVPNGGLRPPQRKNPFYPLLEEGAGAIFVRFLHGQGGRKRTNQSNKGVSGEEAIGILLQQAIGKRLAYAGLIAT